MQSGNSLTYGKKALLQGAHVDPRVLLLTVGALLFLGYQAQASQTVYVDGTAGSDTWTGLCRTHVSGSCGPKKTIQAGINAAVSGDTVIVANGTYSGVGNQEITYSGRLITVRSENGPESCVLDGGGADIRIFVFNTNETADAVLDGFTVTHTELC